MDEFVEEMGWKRFVSYICTVARAFCWKISKSSLSGLEFRTTKPQPVLSSEEIHELRVYE